jgi:hypothetical protein
VIDEENALQVLVTNEDNGLQVEVTNDENGLQVQVTNHGVPAGFDGQEWAEEPELGVTAAGPERAEEEEKEHYMDHGVDPDGDDPIGANEEWRYFKKQQKVPRAVGNGDNEEVMQEKRRLDKNGSAYEAIDPDVVPSDEATMLRDAPYVAHTTYDRDNPEIKGGSTFVDKDAFLLVIKQYAIKREFQTYVEHSDKSRYRAKCADSQCDWKIYAKKLLGCPTFMVYTCVCVFTDYFQIAYDAYCLPNLCIFLVVLLLWYIHVYAYLLIIFRLLVMPILYQTFVFSWLSYFHGIYMYMRIY